MALREMLSLYGRIALIVAAFAFVASIVAGPLLEKVLLSQLMITERSAQPLLPSADNPSEQQSGRPG
jgi:hypothetical protein